MFALTHYAAGIAVIHLFWAFFYLCGSIVWTPRLSAAPTYGRGAPGALLEVVLATATGIAIVGFASFVLGMLGLLYPATAAVFTLAMLAGFHFLGDSPSQPTFWMARWRVVRAAVTPASMALYVLTLVLAVPALLPESGFDALFYHLVYALDWAHAHRIYVDPWVRFPYYAHNWILIDTWMFELGGGSYIDFLGWLSGALAILGTYGLVEALGERLPGLGRRTIQAAAFLSAASVLTAPVFLRWVDSGMVDVTIGFYFLVSVASTVMAIATRDRRWVIYTVACFAFFVGTKGSFLAFLPPAIIAVWIASRSTGMAMRSSYVACAVALILCSPWYAKNLIQAGDPVAPYLHLALHQPDSKWTPEDMQGVMADLKGDQRPIFLLKLPVNIVRHPDSIEYREPGVSLLMLLVFLPGIIFAYGLYHRGGALRSPSFVFAALLFYAVVYWLVTTHLGRYALLFYPSLAAFAGLIALKLVQQSARSRGIVLVLLACAALPAPAGAAWLESWWQTDYETIDQTVSSAAYITATMPDYREEERISSTLSKANVVDPRVYVIGDNELPYYFKLHGISQVGDWFGPERYIDFATAIDRGTAPAFLEKLHIDAVLVSPHPLFSLERRTRLALQLQHAGYRMEQLPGQPATMFFGPGF